MIEFETEDGHMFRIFADGDVTYSAPNDISLISYKSVDELPAEAKAALRGSSSSGTPKPAATEAPKPAPKPSENPAESSKTKAEDSTIKGGAEAPKGVEKFTTRNAEYDIETKQDGTYVNGKKLENAEIL
jgi:hypothetical protein